MYIITQVNDSDILYLTERTSNKVLWSDDSLKAKRIADYYVAQDVLAFAKSFDDTGKRKFSIYKR